MGTSAVRRTKLYQKVMVRGAQIEAVERERLEQKEREEQFARELAEKRKRGPYRQSPYAKLVDQNKRTRVAVVIAAASRYFGYSGEEFKGKSHLPDLVYARHVAMYVAYHHSGHGFAGVGREFKRDHTTIIHAVKKIDALLDANDPIAMADVEQVRLLAVGVNVEDLEYWGA